ncbi:tetrahydrofolylpolyglutamate synthase [Cavenderia fasciculata]|uniref:tetrahydrofolate synthase n=1 Tax=Cavenderia fasciculata TaxID=261658 RepID=F4PRZ6_CACFS|nr:tetrahydrofolylpolyglutamate synthase [Cavenderia fasciculata]EGG20594.1 tetrahydrofolylpolyglutamate synthase [Cavenderia fasciculata]|eukprot:XP_004358444.1 tetrahydrofolylpolyglutamate synthase [Cavenderia fasciculata]
MLNRSISRTTTLFNININSNCIKQHILNNTNKTEDSWRRSLSTTTTTTTTTRYQHQQQQQKHNILLHHYSNNINNLVGRRMLSNDSNSIQQQTTVNNNSSNTEFLNNIDNNQQHQSSVDKNQKEEELKNKKGSVHGRTFEDAIEKLFSMQSNQKTVESWATSRLNEKNNKDSNNNQGGIGFDIMSEVREYCKILEIDLEKPSVIHIAGTKGKGSTCAMVESMIRNQGFTTGLFTSPHLISPRERIKINGEMVSKEVFTENFWFCWDRLLSKDFQFMVFFRFITMLALRIFQQLNVQCTILEVGIGGRIDSTNVFPKPTVTAITALGYDHMNVLGNTLGEIASEKAGIIKKGCPIFTVDQLPEAMQVIEDTSKRVDAPLNVVPDFGSYHLTGPIGLEGDFQKQNSALAIAVCNAWLVNSKLTSKEQLDTIFSASPSYKDYNVDVNNYQASYFTPLPLGIQKGLEKVEWPGRAQTLVSKDNPLVQFHLDGAHTKESALVCLDWWKEKCHDSDMATTEYILIYNCTGGRNAGVFLEPFTESIERGEIPAFSQLFVPHLDKTNTHIYSKGTTDDNNISIEQTIAAKYIELSPTRPNKVYDCIDIPTTVQTILDYSRDNNGKKIKVLATGSLYIVGGVLQSVTNQSDQYL